MYAWQEDDLPEEDEESEREAQLLLIELETMKAVEQIQMLQQVCCTETLKTCCTWQQKELG